MVLACSRNAALKEKLYEEIVGRIKQDDSSVPYRLRGYWYYSRYETGKDYPVMARRAGSMNGTEEVLLDENAMAEGHSFFSVGESKRIQRVSSGCGNSVTIRSSSAPSKRPSRTMCGNGSPDW